MKYDCTVFINFLKKVAIHNLYFQVLLFFPKIYRVEKKRTEVRITKTMNGPRGKESTKVRITQYKGKESENSYQKLK